MPAGSDHCWICRWEERHAEKTDEGKAASNPMAALSGVKSARGGGTPRANPYQQPFSFQFTSATLLFVLFMVVVLASITVIMPGLGIPLIILSIPAGIRTIVIVSRQESRGRAMPLKLRIEAFLAASFTIISILLAVFVAAFAAFSAICLPVTVIANGAPLPDWVAIVFVAVGVLAGLFVLIMLVRIWFRHQAKLYGWNDKQDRS